jgi:hypothetical protein
MDFLRKHFDGIYWCWTLATFISSAVAFGYLLLVSLLVGFDHPSFNWLIGLSLLSTIALLIGAIFSLLDRKWVGLLILLGSSYPPIAFIVLALHGFAPSLTWWIVFAINLIEIFLTSLRIIQLSPPEVTPCPQ